MRYIITLLFLLLLISIWLSLFTGCAQVEALTGGPRDTIPPQLDTARSTVNMQTRFQKQPILLVFDEFVDLKDVFNQVVVSPPLAKQPKVTLEKYKHVKFEFDEEEVLREDATYTIQFGDAIKDFSEGNASPFRFIFSTGDYIDSLWVQGTVIDAFDGKPVDKVLVMLYDNLADTAVRKELPFYFSKTDPKGSFRIENVKSDTFRVFVLEDGNLNYRFDQVSERIGFIDVPIRSDDYLRAPIRIRFFREEAPLQLQSHEAGTPGLVKLVFNREPWDLKLGVPERVLFKETIKDTVFLWHEMADSSAWSLYLESSGPIDTLNIRPLTRPGNWDQLRLLQDKKAEPGSRSTHNPAGPIPIRMNFPITTVNLDSIQLWEDSIRLEDKNLRLDIDSLDRRTLQARFAWEESHTYRLVFLPGALQGWQGTGNDSLLLEYRIGRRNDYGSLHLNIDSLETEMSYAIELLQQDKVLRRFQIDPGQRKWETRLEGLSTGLYQLRLIEDPNGNGRWDPGRYDDKLQPERMLLWPIEQIRANWEVEANFVLRWE